MIDSAENTAAVRLIKLARHRCEDLGRRIGELERACAELAFAIQSVDDAVVSERRTVSASDAQGLLDLARYEAAASQRRAALKASAAAMTEEIERSRHLLTDAFAELKKLEHVAELARQATARRRAARDLAALDEAARLRFAARS
jgi:flagellar export protein FliJ